MEYLPPVTDAVRYYISLILLVAVPAAIVFWLLVHPFARFWRRAGTGRAYAVLGTVVAAVMISMVLLRRPLLVGDLGGSLPLATIGVICLVLSGWLLLRLRQKLTLKTMLGVPELSSDPGAGALITDGIYARIRHPRYTQMTLTILGDALIANYPAAYGAFLLWCVGIYLVTVLEERELEARFGSAYRTYRKEVPRFVPRFRS